MDLHTGAVPGDEAVPDSRIGWCMEATLVRVAGGRAKAALATARRTGVTEAGFCIATEDRPREGSSKVPADGVGRGGWVQL